MNPATFPRDQEDLQHRESTSAPAALHLVADLDPQYREYPNIEPGTYVAYCNSAQWYRDPSFRR